MKKKICIILTCILLCVLASPAMAADEGPVITLQPQSPTYTPYSVALYIVKAEGENLTATWYMDFLGEEYNISDLGGTMQPWEPFAGASYGPRQLDANTFSYTFEGIEYDLDGARIWCVISDGTNSVTSQKVRVSVKDFGAPPRIVDIPAQITVEQYAEAEIRCVATSPAENVQLMWRWFETKTGLMEDMEAVTDFEHADFLVLDTTVIGTRYYFCQVMTTEGGIAYSSIVPVTVTEKVQVPNEPTNPPTEPTVPPTEPTDPPTEPTVPPTEPTDPPVDTPNDPPKQPNENNGNTNNSKNSDGTSWPVLVLVGLGSAVAGVGMAVLVTKKKR